MKGVDKIKLLKEILADKDIVSKKILKEEPEETEGLLEVSAEGKSPEDAKEKIISQLESMKLPTEEEMPEMEDEEEMPEMEDEEEEDFPMSEEDSDIMEMLPEKTRMQFKKRLMEKIKSL